jgi:hypothetical protein
VEVVFGELEVAGAARLQVKSCGPRLRSLEASFLLITLLLLTSTSSAGAAAPVGVAIPTFMAPGDPSLLPYE